MTPRIVKRERTRISDWVEICARTVEFPESTVPQTYHSLTQADYIVILAIMPDGRIPLVRQYRPALERYTLELPGGLLEAGEEPAHCAEREMLEEAGLANRGAVIPLGVFPADSGRLSNMVRAFAFPQTEPTPGWVPEEGVEMQPVSLNELKTLLLAGELGSSTQIGAIALAMLTGVLQFGVAT